MSKIKDSLIGFAIGDAMGVPIEFKKREELLKNPVTKMIGYGSHNMPAGTWSDDTSMTIATMDSIIKKNSIDYKNIMDLFLVWFTLEKYTATGTLFGIGTTCSKALAKYYHGRISPLKCGLSDEYSNGNGSLMRMLPIAFYIYYKNLKDDEMVDLVNNISSLTHAHEISKMACYIYTRYMLFLISGKDKFESYNLIKKINYNEYYTDDTIKKFRRILNDDIFKLNIEEIKSSGYVIDSLEASLWVLLNAKDYKEAIIGSINLGDDTDTIGAITGSMAGIIYGYDDIPKSWLIKLARLDYLEKLGDDFENTLNNINSKNNWPKAK